MQKQTFQKAIALFFALVILLTIASFSLAATEGTDETTRLSPGDEDSCIESEEPIAIQIDLHGNVTVTPGDLEYEFSQNDCGSVTVRLPAGACTESMRVSMAGGWQVFVLEEALTAQMEEEDALTAFDAFIPGNYSLVVFEPFDSAAVPSGDGPTAPDAPTRDQVSIIRFTDVQSLALGGIALDAAGKVWSWGWNNHGQLGLGWTETLRYAGGMRRIPFFVENNIRIERIFAGYHTAAAICEDGRVFMWGRGTHGQMGNGVTTSGTANHSPAQIPASRFDNRRISRVALTTFFDQGSVFAICEAGDVWAWGSVYTNRIPGFGWDSASSPGASGSGGARHFNIPQRVTDFDNTPAIAEISLGHSHGIALDVEGNVWSWGYGLRGSLGRGANPGRSEGGWAVDADGGLGRIPFFYENNITVASISAAYHTNVVVCTEGRAFSWGWRWETTAGATQSWSHPATGEMSWFDGSVGPQIVNVPRRVLFDLTSSLWNEEYPRVASASASGRVIYLLDVYGRLWYQGFNEWYSFATDGPLFPSLGGGKHRGVVPRATLLRTMGDGSTQRRVGDVMAPVFSDQPRGGGTGYGLNEEINHWLTAVNTFIVYGRWSSVSPWNNGAVAATLGNYVGDGLHPTIYDKVYMVLSPDTPLPAGILPNTGDGRNAQAILHRFQYPIDADGYRLVYIVRSQDGVAGANGLVRGDFYRASRNPDYPASGTEWLYNGPWAVNQHNTVALPAGVSEVTSVPQIRYTPVTVQHRGVDVDDNATIVYAPSANNVTKGNTDPSNTRPAPPASNTLWGLPLDANGNAIADPSFGYDIVEIARYNPLPAPLQLLWDWYDPGVQAEKVEITLNDADLFRASGQLLPFVHDFFYDRLPPLPDRPFVFYKVCPAGEPVLGAQFHLYRWNPAGSGNWVRVSFPAVRSTAPDGLVEFSLSYGGSYRVVETAAPAPFQTPTGYWTVILDDTGAITSVTAHGGNPPILEDGGNRYLQNTRYAANLHFIKTGNADSPIACPCLDPDCGDAKPLSGATFRLYHRPGGPGAPWVQVPGVPDVTSDAAGLVSFPNLPNWWTYDAPQFKLREIQAPADFATPGVGDHWYVTLDPWGTVVSIARSNANTPAFHNRVAAASGGLAAPLYDFAADEPPYVPEADEPPYDAAGNVPLGAAPLAMAAFAEETQAAGEGEGGEYEPIMSLSLPTWPTNGATLALYGPGNSLFLQEFIPPADVTPYVAVSLASLANPIPAGWEIMQWSVVYATIHGGDSNSTVSYGPADIELPGPVLRHRLPDSE